MADEKKMQSRKFVVWLCWAIVALVMAGISIAAMAITREIPETAVELAESAIGYFFAISMMYLGVNVGQKVGLKLCDSMNRNQDQEEKE